MLDLPDINRIRAFAGDEAAFRNAQSVARPDRWINPGQREAALWGEYRGSGATPYRVFVTLDDLTVACSCPSRKTPCKHVVGLLLLAVQHPTVTGDMVQLMQALPGLMQTARYSNVRKSDVTIIRTLAVEILTRVCIGLPLACVALSDEAAKELFEQIVAVHRHIPLLEDDTHMQAWRATLTRLADMPAHGLIQGAATRLLHDEGEETATASRMNRALSPTAAAARAAVWLEGFLFGDALALIHNPNLWRILDNWLVNLSEPAFVAQLPILRRSFQRFEPAARRQLGDLARNGPVISTRETPMQTDNARAERALALLRLIEQAEEAAGGR